MFVKAKTKGRTPAVVLALWGWQAQADILANIHTPPFLCHPPPQSPFNMNWIIWRIPNTNHKNGELFYKSVTREARTKKLSVSQGNLHTILISSIMVTKDRKWVSGHQCIQTEVKGWAGFGRLLVWIWSFLLLLKVNSKYKCSVP